MIELYDLAGHDPGLRFSPFCWRIRMALAHKGIEPDLVPWRFHEAAKLPGTPANSQVPVLVDGDTIVADSGAIADYLEGRYANGPSLFGGPGGEAHVRFIVAWTDSVLAPGIFPIAAWYVARALHPDDRAYFRRSREARLGTTLEDARDAAPERLAGLRDSLDPLRRVVEAQPFAGGEEPSYADYALFGCFQWARCLGAPELLSPDDPVFAWRDTMLNLFDGLGAQAPVAA